MPNITTLLLVGGVVVVGFLLYQQSQRRPPLSPPVTQSGYGNSRTPGNQSGGVVDDVLKLITTGVGLYDKYSGKTGNQPSPKTYTDNNPYFDD